MKKLKNIILIFLIIFFLKNLYSKDYSLIIQSTTSTRDSGFYKFIFGFFSVSVLLSRLRPEVAVGFGGYPSIPTMLAAKLLQNIRMLSLLNDLWPLLKINSTMKN